MRALTSSQRVHARAFLSDCYMKTNMQCLDVQVEVSDQPDFVVMATRMQQISCLQVTHSVFSVCARERV